MPIPVVYVADGCIIDLQQVATVICSHEIDKPVCRVILKSGVSFQVDMQYSRSLIQAIEWSRSPGSVVKPKDELSQGDQGECINNKWGN